MGILNATEKEEQYKKTVGWGGQMPIISRTREDLLRGIQNIVGVSKQRSVESDKQINGVDFGNIQWDKFRDAYDNKMITEFDCFSPYLQDYNTKTGEVWRNNLTNGDEISIQIAKMLWEELEDSHVQQIMLYDEHNNELPDSSDPYGRPTRELLDEN